MRIISWAVSGVALLLPPSLGAAPSVALTAPIAETRYLAPAAIELAADPVVDAGRSIERVEFLADGAVIGTATQAPYTFSWTNVAKGNYNLRARVFDSAGARDASPVVRIHVRDNTPPKVRVSAPEHRFIAPGSVPLTAEVTDRDDPIAKVEFFNGETLLATLTAEPYALSWTDVPAGNYDIRATATDSLGAVGTSNLFRVRVRDNLAPRVRILGPENNTTYAAPATIPISLRAVDRDDNLTNVELFANGSPLTTFSVGPYEFNWSGMQPGTYALTARATDDLGLITTSRTVNITITGTPPTAEPKLYFIHVDHLNTPRLVADEQQRVVWRWDQHEPFGDSLPDENPSGLGIVDLPLRLPGQYFDKETNLNYNYFRDYDAALGKYVQSDPVGLKAGVNTYAYVNGQPLIYFDPNGLEVRFICRSLGDLAVITGKQHCFVHVTCPEEGWASTLSLYANGGLWPKVGFKSANDGPDNPNAPSTFNQPVAPPNQCFPDRCGHEKAILRRFNSFQGGLVSYGPTGPNSNSFAAGLITGNQFGGTLPPGAPGWWLAPGIDMQHPGFASSPR